MTEEFKLDELMQKHSHMEEGIQMIMFNRIMELNKEFIKRIEKIILEWEDPYITCDKLNKLAGSSLVDIKEKVK